MNKQLIIHVAAELLIICTITILFNKRVNKVEESLLMYDKKFSEMKETIGYLFQVIESQNQKIQQLSNIVQSKQTKQSQNIPLNDVSPNSFIHSVLNLQPHKQPNVEIIPIQIPSTTQNPLHNILNIMSQSLHLQSQDQPNVEILPEEKKQVTISEDIDSDSEEDILNQTLQTLLTEPISTNTSTTNILENNVSVDEIKTEN